MSGSIYDWSTTASDNDSADGDINWIEGQNAKTVNNSARQGMARNAEWLEDLCGTQTVGGTANAITVTLDSGFTTLANKRIIGLRPTSDNTGATTLNVNSIGAKAIRKFDSTGEVALASGDLQAGNVYLLIYSTAANSSAGAWILLNPTAQPQNAKLTAIAGLAVTDGNIIVGDGTTWVAESGSTARTSLGLATVASTGAYSDLSGTPTLGTAAAKNVGTTTGTVAAGDDSRITGALSSSSTITDVLVGRIQSPANQTYMLAVKVPYAFTITETTTICESGTCTATFKINTTALGGTANSVSTSETSQAQSTSNTGSAGDDIQVTISSNSSCVGMSFHVKFTRALS